MGKEMQTCKGKGEVKKEKWNWKRKGEKRKDYLCMKLKKRQGEAEKVKGFRKQNQSIISQIFSIFAVNVGFVGQYDCPVFEDIYPFCQLYTGGSVGRRGVWI